MRNQPSLPEEVIEDILYRLPAKTIGRCRCVSKAWLALLTQPHFIKTHLRHTHIHPTHSLLLISTFHGLFSLPLTNAHHLFDRMSTWATKLNFPNKTHFRIKLLASCDGLVLLSEESFILGYKDLKMWLMNPTTRVITSVPFSPFTHGPRDGYPLYGLGYDEVGDDYKVVSLNTLDYDADHIETICSVLSVKSGAWRRLERSPYNNTVVPFVASPPVFVDGCIHWLALCMTDCSSVIIAFNLSDEKFFEVPLPKFDGSEYAFHKLGVLGGCLCLVPDNDNKRTGVWVKKECGVRESWSKFTIVNPEDERFGPLCLLAKEQVVLIKDETTPDEKLVTYDFKTQTMKDIIVVTDIPGGFRIGLTYTESLISPNGQLRIVEE